MKEYKVFRSAGFKEEVAKYDSFIQERIDKIEEKLRHNANYGNPLGTRWFREARFENYRVYYLVYDNLSAIYMVAISNKKDQQKTINTIRLFLDFFREEIEGIIQRDKDA